MSATAEDSPDVARIKGRRAWAGIISRAVKAKQRVLPQQDLHVDGVVLQLRPEEVREAQARARRTGHPHNRARCGGRGPDRKSTRLNSSHVAISYAVFCLKKKKHNMKNYTKLCLN